MPMPQPGYPPSTMPYQQPQYPPQYHQTEDNGDSVVDEFHSKDAGAMSFAHYIVNWVSLKFHFVKECVSSFQIWIILAKVSCYSSSCWFVYVLLLRNILSRSLMLFVYSLRHTRKHKNSSDVDEATLDALRKS